MPVGKLDPDFIPAHAIHCWADDHDLYVALPMTSGGQPYIARYPLSESGLSTALEVLRKRRKEVLAPTAAQPTNYTQQPMVKTSKAQERLHAETTPEQRAAAKALIEKLGLKRG